MVNHKFYIHPNNHSIFSLICPCKFWYIGENVCTNIAAGEGKQGHYLYQEPYFFLFNLGYQLCVIYTFFFSFTSLQVMSLFKPFPETAYVYTCWGIYSRSTDDHTSNLYILQCKCAIHPFSVFRYFLFSLFHISGKTIKAH